MSITGVRVEVLVMNFMALKRWSLLCSFVCLIGVLFASEQTANVFQISQPGRIVGLRFTPAQAFTGKARDIVLRAYWDGDNAPAIDAPAGDFFGYGWGEPAMKSLLIGTNDKGNYCYWPMPFDKQARIELASQRENGKAPVTGRNEKSSAANFYLCNFTLDLVE